MTGTGRTCGNLDIDLVGALGYEYRWMILTLVVYILAVNETREIVR